MPSRDRQRALARAKLERQMARRAAAARRRRQVQAAGGATLALIAVIAGTVFLVQSFGGKSQQGQQANANGDKKPECVYEKAARDPKVTKDVGLPPSTGISRTGTRAATLQTNVGSIEVSLDQERASCTVNSFTYLASKNYFNNTICHRLTTQGIYVLQCGDPSGTGAGGPGYQFADENLPAGQEKPYPAGTLAMANSGPGTNGSQFFIVYKQGELGPNYSVFGRITKGLDVVEKVAKAGVASGGQPGDGAPKEKVTITSVKLGAAS